MRVSLEKVSGHGSITSTNYTAENKSEGFEGLHVFIYTGGITRGDATHYILQGASTNGKTW